MTKYVSTYYANDTSQSAPNTRSHYVQSITQLVNQLYNYARFFTVQIGPGPLPDMR